MHMSVPLKKWVLTLESDTFDRVGCLRQYNQSCMHMMGSVQDATEEQ